jgi:hypothetical protein
VIVEWGGRVCMCVLEREGGREREGGCQRGEVTQHGINYQVPERVKSFRNNGAPFLPSSCSLTLTSSLQFLTPGGEQNQGKRGWYRLRWSNCIQAFFTSRFKRADSCGRLTIGLKCISRKNHLKQLLS